MEEGVNPAFLSFEVRKREESRMSSQGLGARETLIKSQSPIWHVFSCNASS